MAQFVMETKPNDLQPLCSLKYSCINHMKCDFNYACFEGHAEEVSHFRRNSMFKVKHHIFHCNFGLRNM